MSGRVIGTKIFYPQMSLSMTSVDQFVNFFLSIVSMQISGKPWFVQERTVWILRTTYVVSNLIQLGFFFYIKHRIEQSKDQRKVKIKREPSLFQDNETEEENEMTYEEYDGAELAKTSRSAMIQFVIVCVLHLKWRVVQPLFVQSFAPIRSLFLSPLYSAYVWNRPVLRPFEQNMLFQKIPSVAEKKRSKEE